MDTVLPSQEDNSSSQIAGEQSGFGGSLIPHFIVFLVLSYFAFRRNPFAMFWSEEGLSTKLLYREQCLWDSMAPFLQMSHHGGIGDQSFGVQTRLMPPLAVQCLAGITELHPLAAYMVYAAEIFLAVYFFGRAFAFSSRQSLAAAWASAILMLPYMAPDKIYPVGHTVPFFVETIATMCLALAAFAQIGRAKSVATNVLLGVACGALVIWHTCANPQFTVMALPFVGILGLTAAVMSASRAELAWKVGAAAIILLLFVLGRFPNFVLGLVEYSDVYFFPDELQSPQAHLWYGSILFQSSIYTALPPLIWFGALAGGILRLFWPNRRQRCVAIGHLCGMVLILIAALILHSPSSTYKSLKVAYVEELFWPIYLLHVAAFLGAAWAWTGFADRFPFSRFAKDALLWRRSLVPYAVLAVVSVFLQRPAVEPPFARESATPITDYLASRIAVTPGSLFRGREASFTGYRDKPPGITWFNLDLPQQFQVTRNEHHLAGLWMFYIPTIQDESAVYSPVLYAVASRLLARQGDQQNRDVLLMTHPDARVLAMIGVRFLVSDEDAIAGTTARLTWNPAPNLTLRVFEIDNPNVGQYSPLRIEVVHSASALLERLHDADPSEVALLDAPLTANLISAHDTRITLERGYIHVQAKSDGESLVILPFEYSHCLRVDNGEGATLMRANLVNTAVLFSKTLDMRLTLEVGPFGAGNCRLRDVADLKAFGLQDLPR